MAKEKSYIRGRPSRACCDLIDALRAVGVSSIVGHKKGVLHVYVDNPEADGPRVPVEFEGYATEVHLDPEPAPPLMHQSVGCGDNRGCAHSRAELRDYVNRGMVPNRDCDARNTQDTASASAHSRT